MPRFVVFVLVAMVLSALPTGADEPAYEPCLMPRGVAALADLPTVPLSRDVPGVGKMAVLVPTAETVGGATPCYGAIRPGGAFGDPFVSCTLSWILRDSDGALYITTAGHCTAPGGSLDAPGIGYFADVVYHSTGVGRDIALARIYEHMYHYVDPSVCHWGGPTGVAEPISGMPLLTYGWGFGNNVGPFDVPVDGRARAGVTVDAISQSITYVGSSFPGDSGGPILSATHEAVGIVTHSALEHGFPVSIGTQLHRALPWMSAALGTDLALVTGTVPRVPGSFALPPTA